jgi:hypothetical protein
VHKPAISLFECPVEPGKRIVVVTEREINFGNTARGHELRCRALLQLVQNLQSRVAVTRDGASMTEAGKIQRAPSERSTDGRSITFNFEGRLYSAPVDDSAEPQLVVTAEPNDLFPLAWSRDGRTLAYSYPVAETAHDVWVLPVGGQPAPFLKTPHASSSLPLFSPDGRWMVYAAKDAGRESEVYVQPYPGPGGRVTVSRGGGVEPVWSPTGREIFYRSVNSRRILAVEVRTEPTFSAGVPQVLFEGNYPIRDSFWSNYDVTADGSQFLMVAGPETAPPGLQVVINWLTEVKQRLAAPD